MIMMSQCERESRKYHNSRWLSTARKTPIAPLPPSKRRPCSGIVRKHLFETSGERSVQQQFLEKNAQTVREQVLGTPHRAMGATIPGTIPRTGFGTMRRTVRDGNISHPSPHPINTSHHTRMAETQTSMCCLFGALSALTRTRTCLLYTSPSPRD